MENNICNLFRCFLPDVRNPKRYKYSIKRRISSIFYRFQKIIHRLFFVSFKREEFVAIASKMKYGYKIRNPSKFKKKLDLFLAETIDTQSLFRDEHLELPLDLRWAVPIRTKNSHLSLILFESGRTHWTRYRREYFFFASCTNLRDN